jgi:glycosyltransferase involved in cell wall biosynthesis
LSRVILYVAAHGGPARESVPLGGGAAVFDHLVAEWTRTGVPFRTITPRIPGRDLVRFSEREYAGFCRDFEQHATNEILRHDPAATVVLANDVSEGPDFTRLAAAGFRIFTIYHVDVVAYVAEIYLRGWIAPQTTVRWERRLRPMLPGIARLIWEKQEASVRHSRGLIVPSAGMRDILARCYPGCESKIHVIPWGVWDSGEPVSPEALRAEYGVKSTDHVLLTLSRISPEKGQDLLLEALLDWDPPLWLFICGAPAYMQGERFLLKLRRRASRLHRTRVVFPGHVTGARKRQFFSLADLYLFPSRHESYGLTLLEALAAGVPAVCLDTAGARAVMRPEFGAVIDKPALRHTIEKFLADAPLRRRMSESAKAFALSQPFSEAAARLAKLLL